ncbi:hypothetical protein ACIFOC_01721 [Leucobacter aridicollis]|nr:iron-containing outer membrane protein [Mycolicibacterium mucogenicum 261Sha1.1M5]
MSESSREAADQRDLLHQVHLSTEEGVYGLILVAGLIAVAGSTGQGPVQTLAFIAITVAVFWAAHVYAGTVAAHSGSAAAHASLGVAFRHSLRRSRGLLTAVLPPAIPLVLSAAGIFDARTADWLALWAIVGVLAVLGYLAYARKGAAIHVRLIGAASTAAFGVVIILAKALLHH